MKFLPTVFCLLLLPSLSICRGQSPAQPKTDDIKELLAALERRQSPEPEDKNSKYYDTDFSDLFQKACAQAGEADRIRLAAIFNRTDPGPRKEKLFRILTKAQMEKTLAEIKAHPCKFGFPVLPASERAPRLPQGSAEAWNLYRSVFQSYDGVKFSALEKGTPGYWNDPKAYGENISLMLLRPKEVAAENFVQTVKRTLHTGMNCLGPDSTTQAAPYPHAAFFLLLQQKRYREALGASLESSPVTSPFYREEICDSQPVLAALLPDWEKFLAGALAAKVIEGTDAHDPFLEFPLVILGTYGTDQSALRICELIPLFPPELQTRLIKVLGAYLPSKSPAPMVFRYPFKPIKRISPPVTAATEEALLNFLDNTANEKASLEICRAVAETLGEKKHPKTVEILMRLLNHKAKEVAEASSQSLSDSGVKAKPTQIQPPLPIVVQINGIVRPGLSVSWDVDTRKPGDRGTSTTGGLDTTDGNGKLLIPSKYFVDPEIKPEYISLSTHGNSPKTPLFGLDFPPPKNLTESHTIHIKTLPLELRLLFPEGRSPNKNEEMSVSLELKTFEGSSETSSFETPVSNSVKFDSVQEGSYKVRLKIPGIALYNQEFPKSDSRNLELRLERGFTVARTLKTPEGWPVEQLTQSLYRNGEPFFSDPHWNSKDGAFSHLPEGNYILKIPSSSDMMKNYPGLKSRSEGLQPFMGRDIPFQLDEKSPQVVNLGEIVLAPEDK